MEHKCSAVVFPALCRKESDGVSVSDSMHEYIVKQKTEQDCKMLKCLEKQNPEKCKCTPCTYLRASSTASVFNLSIICCLNNEVLIRV